MNISVSTLVVVASFGLALFAFVMGAIRNLKKDLIKHIEGLGTRVDDLNTRVGNLETSVETRFNSMETRFNGIELRFNGIEDRLNGIDARLNGTEDRFGRIETSINQLYILVACALSSQGVEFPREALFPMAMPATGETTTPPGEPEPVPG